MLQNLKHNIKDKLKQFKHTNLKDNFTSLLNTLGYNSDRTIDLELDNCESFFKGKLNKEKALFDDWQKLGLIFQLTEQEIINSLFKINKLEREEYQSYLFIAIELKNENYARGKLAQITRSINKTFPMPVMILFKYDTYLTLSIINRRPSKRDYEKHKDVLEKVTLIKDINYSNPHRAHIEILHDLSFHNLNKKGEITNFIKLHKAWQEKLDTSELNKKFYREIANWYFWAIDNTTFPSQNEIKNNELRNAIGIIRLITRLIFCWFIKEKGLIPDTLFDEKYLNTILKHNDKNNSTYYKAILQNLFFATLNMEMNKREFRKIASQKSDRDQHYLITNLYRYETYFEDTTKALELFKNIPFLNGGLFECLDKKADEIIRIDGFSDRADNKLEIPDFLFFSEKQSIDSLNKIYGTKNKKYNVRGIIDILNRYKFTITENTPIEEEIALDPELLGKVFENLLASYNPETGTTARKQTGSFYTPREIVNYMVDESIIAYLENKLTENKEENKEDINDKLHQLLSYTEEAHPFSENDIKIIIEAINNIKILDPACGSGAFPMGILHKLVFILSRLDPNNKRWKNKQIEKAEAIDIADTRDKTIEDIEESFANNELDYPRKLYLIQNCIYGVDIQPIAIQIAKLRFFISLIIDQKVNTEKDNLGIRALPNLETKFVAANTLISLEKPQQAELENKEIERKEEELKKIREKYFNAKTPKTKDKYRKKDEKLRLELSQLLKIDGFSVKSSKKIANWNPYDQNKSTDFFDMEFMFGIKEGFDIVIANPPYIRQEKIRHLKPILQKQGYEVYNSTSDIYTYFYEQAYNVLKNKGICVFITSNKWARAKYGQKLRKFFKNKVLLKQIIDFGGYQIFDATVDTNILIFQRLIDGIRENNEVKVVSIKDDFTIDTDLISYTETHNLKMQQKSLDEDSFTFANKNIIELKQKIEKIGTPLKDWDVKIYRGITTGFNKAFVIDKVTKERLCAEDPKSEEIIKPLLRGRDINKWYYIFKDYYLIYTYAGININKYPTIIRYLEQYKDELKEVWEAKHGKKKWYELRGCKYYGEFEKEKIVWAEISGYSKFTWDTEKFFALAKVFIMTGKESNKYLLAILNSALGNYSIKKYYAPFLGTKASEFKKEWVQKMPIPKIPELNQQPLINLVDQILTYTQSEDYLQNAQKQSIVKDLEYQIDQLVYKLYNLTEEEIKIIEEN